MSPLDDLPLELIIEILQYLDLKSLLTCRQVRWCPFFVSTGDNIYMLLL